ncbi:NADPH-dependent FMN reductase [Alishewanella sp. HL-SH06]|uniref:NADPH-dependent FMN reductase n=1 Tax=Alishewanella sp. HL-SH06 TaxID=3461144 RepID=UPI004042AF7C
MTKTLNVLAICGSLRAKSTNRGMLLWAQAHAPKGMKIHLADLLDVPFYNADLAAKPAAVSRLLNDFAQADALILGCPEYNYSLAPALKNALDWASREPDNYLLRGKAVAIMGAAGGMGSSRAQYHLRQVCVYLDLHPLNKPEVFANAFSGAFDNEGHLIDSKIQENIKQQLLALAAWQQKLQP